MPVIDPEVVAVVAIVAAALASVLLLVVVVLALRLRKLGSSLRRAVGTQGDDLVTAVARHSQHLAAHDARLDALDARSDELRELLRGTTSRVGLVRYDAFADMGGALSYSAALLDERADGIVISAINGRTETRSYAKPVVGGRSDHSLSDEEAAAVEAAREGWTATTMPAGRGRRRRGANR